MPINIADDLIVLSQTGVCSIFVSRIELDAGGGTMDCIFSYISIGLV